MSYGKAIGDAVARPIIIIAAIAFAAGALTAWLLPILWHFAKPIIHTFTG